jgi:hypothetical protein
MFRLPCRAAAVASALVLTLLCIDAALAQSSKGAPATPPQPPAVTSVPQITVTPPPSSAIGTPMTPLSPLPPLSPQVTTTPLTGGSITTRVPSSTPSSASASEANPSAPGGGGKSLADCVGFWDRETHMTKGEWRAACQRSLTRLENLKIDDLFPPTKTKR